MENQLTTSNPRDQLAIIPSNHVREFSKKLTATSITSRIEEILKHHPALIIKLIAYARHKVSASSNSPERSHMNYVLLADSIMQGIKDYSNPEVIKNLDIGIDLVTKLINEHSHDVLYLIESMFLERVDIHVSLLYNRFYKTMIQAFHSSRLHPSSVGLNLQNEAALNLIDQLSFTPTSSISENNLEIILTCYNSVKVEKHWWKGDQLYMGRSEHSHENLTVLKCNAREDVAISRQNIENFGQVVEAFQIVNNEFVKTHETLREGSKNTALTAEQINQQKKQLDKISNMIETDGVNERNKDDLLDLIDACQDYNQKANNFLSKTSAKTDCRMKELHDVKKGVHDSIIHKRPLALQDLQPNKKALIEGKGMFSDDKENTVFNRIDGLSA